MKKCTNKNCVQINPQSLSYFHKDTRAKDGFKRICKSCCTARMSEWYENNKARSLENGRRFSKLNPSWAVERRLRKKYGMTIEQYAKMFADQKERCAICNKHQSELDRRLAVDHNHIAGKIRGLLCLRCNTDLGKFENNPSLFLKMKEYLDEKNHK